MAPSLIFDAMEKISRDRHQLFPSGWNPGYLSCSGWPCQVGCFSIALYDMAAWRATKERGNMRHQWQLWQKPQQAERAQWSRHRLTIVQQAVVQTHLKNNSPDCLHTQPYLSCFSPCALQLLTRATANKRTRYFLNVYGTYQFCCHVVVKRIHIQ